LVGDCHWWGKSLRVKLKAWQIDGYPMLLAVVVVVAQHEDSEGQYCDQTRWLRGATIR